MKHNHKLALKTAIVLAMIICFAAFFPAQIRGQVSGLRGTVYSEGDDPLPKVKITIQRVGWQKASSFETAMCGCFDSGFLLPGEYDVEFRLAGYRTAIYRNLPIPEGRFVRLEVYLERIDKEKGDTGQGTGKIEAEDEVAVVYDPPYAGLLEESDPYGTTFDTAMLAMLPRGTNPLSLATLASGVNDELLFDGLSINGASSSENVFFVDGTDTTTIYSGQSGFDVHIDFVDEIRVQATGLPASRSGSTGGVIDIVTKSGGNQFHGSLQLYVTGYWLDGKPRRVLQLNRWYNLIAEYTQYLEDTWTRWQPGFTLGGYLVKDKLWFYGGFIPSFLILTREGVFQNTPELTRPITQKTAEYQAILKMTGFLTDRLRLSLSGLMDYRIVEGGLPELDGTSDYFTDFSEGKWLYPSVSLSGSLDYAGRDISLRFSGNFWRKNASKCNVCVSADVPCIKHMRSPNDYGIPGIYGDYWLTDYYCCGYRLKRSVESRLNLGTDWHTRFQWGGDHRLSAGVHYSRQAVDKDYSYNDFIHFFWGDHFESRVTGESIPTTLGYVEVIKPYGIVADTHSDSWAVFLEDDWGISRSLRLQWGVRMESERLPSFSDLPGFTESPFTFGLLDKLAPRLGFVYEWGNKGDGMAYGSYAVYFDRMKWWLAQQQYGGFKSVSHFYDIVYYYWEEFSAMEHPASSYMGGRYFESYWYTPEFSVTQPDIEPFRKHELSLGFQKRIGSLWELNVRAVHHWIRHPIEDIGLEYGGGEYVIGNPGSDWVQDKFDEMQLLGLMTEGVESVEAVRRYTSLTVSLDRRFSRRWLGGISYTWSRLFGNYSGLTSSEEYGRPEPQVWNFHYIPRSIEKNVFKPNMTGSFDVWFKTFDHNGEATLGLLPTDRTHQIKAYGAYAFDFGLTVGFNGFAMSGTPVQTDVYVYEAPAWFPLGRGDLGRSHWLWQLNAYLEFNLKLNARLLLQLSLNIDNVTDNSTARWIHQLFNQFRMVLDQRIIFDGFDAIDMVMKTSSFRDPRFGMGRDFQAPIAARLGAKLLF